MKNVLAIMALVLVVAACNLTNKLKTNSNVVVGQPDENWRRSN